MEKIPCAQTPPFYKFWFKSMFAFVQETQITWAFVDSSFFGSLGIIVVKYEFEDFRIWMIFANWTKWTLLHFSGVCSSSPFPSLSLSVSRWLCSSKLFNGRGEIIFWRPGCPRVWTCSYISHWETSPWRSQGSRSPLFVVRFFKNISKIFIPEVSKNLSSKTFKTFEFCKLNCKRSERFDCKIAGIFFVLPCIESYQKVDLRTITMGVPPQEVKFTFIVFIHLFPKIPLDSRQEIFITLPLHLCRTCSFYATLEALDLLVGWS